MADDAYLMRATIAEQHKVIDGQRQVMTSMQTTNQALRNQVDALKAALETMTRMLQLHREAIDQHRRSTQDAMNADDPDATWLADLRLWDLLERGDS